MTKTIAVIGSGMTGLVTALSLSKYEYEVTIFSSNIKGEASKAAAGILFPLYPWKIVKTWFSFVYKVKYYLIIILKI